MNQTAIGFYYFPRVAAVGTDRFAVIWLYSPPTGFEQYPVGRIVMDDGSMPFPEGSLASTAGTYAWGPVVAGGPSGNVLAGWTRQPVPADIRVRRFDGALQPLGGDIVVNANPLDPAQGMDAWLDLASMPSGWVATWCLYRPLPVECDVKFRYLDATGNPATAELFAGTLGDDNEIAPHVATDASGNAVIVWSASNGTLGDAFGRLFDPLGNPRSEIFRVNGTMYNTQGAEDVASTLDGDFAVSWLSVQDPGGTDSVFTRRYFFPTSLVLGPARGPSNPATVVLSTPLGDASRTVPAYATQGYGANVGAADVDGDAVSELLTGPGPSPIFGPQVRAFEPATGAPIQKISYYAYGTLRYGVRSAGGRIDPDGYGEILTAPGEGAVFGPHVRGWDYDGGPLRPLSKVNYYAYNTLKWGARAIGGDVDGDGMDEILTAPGPGAVFAPLIRGWQYDGNQVTSIAKINFWPFLPSNPTYGATVAAADVESAGLGAYGDGFDEIVAGIGPDPAFSGQVELWDYDGTQLAFKYRVTPYPTMYGANVAGGDVDAGDAEEVVTAPGPDPAADAHVVVWEWDPVIGVNPDGARLQKLGPDDFVTFPGPPQLLYGANVAVGTFE